MKTIERLKQLLAKATPGPWYRSQNIVGSYHATSGIVYGQICSDATWEDVDLIADTRNALPALLAVVEAAYEYVDRGSGRDDLIAALRALDGETT